MDSFLLELKKMKIKIKQLVVIILSIFLFSKTMLFSMQYMVNQEEILEISTLSSRNPIFAQYMTEIENSYKGIASNKEFSVKFYSYTIQKNETLMQIAARCNIPYEEIALINNINSVDTEIENKKIIIPNAPGLFIPENPSTSIGKLVKQRLSGSEAENTYNIQGELYKYLPQERLTPTERAFFLDATLIMPLEESILTSSYGMRTSPITGDMKFHKGIDLAAPIGTSVYACKNGVVVNATKDKEDKIYGKFIILDHENNTQSVYAHLSKVLVKTGDEITRGTVIGEVGTTGASTGPHLHFEIRVNGKAQDPKRLLPTFN